VGLKLSDEKYGAAVVEATSYASTSTKESLQKQPIEYRRCRRSRCEHKQDEPELFLGSYSKLTFVCYKKDYVQSPDRKVWMYIIGRASF